MSAQRAAVLSRGGSRIATTLRRQPPRALHPDTRITSTPSSSVADEHLWQVLAAYAQLRNHAHHGTDDYT